MSLQIPRLLSFTDECNFRFGYLYRDWPSLDREVAGAGDGRFGPPACSGRGV